MVMNNRQSPRCPLTLPDVNGILIIKRFLYRGWAHPTDEVAEI